MFNIVKTALRITTDAFDNEINSLIAGAIADLGIAGVKTPENDVLIIRAVVTYCRANFGAPAEYDRLKAAYDEQKAQLQMSTGYGM